MAIFTYHDKVIARNLNGEIPYLIAGITLILPR
jgi:hypothetical protein